MLSLETTFYFSSFNYNQKIIIYLLLLMYIYDKIFNMSYFNFHDL